MSVHTVAVKLKLSIILFFLDYYARLRVQKVAKNKEFPTEKYFLHDSSLLKSKHRGGDTL